eukprot:CAMPEP_0170531738 /NCGR_PEP_ID=MMETSP0209-20121228/64644_1 /TAXON_ID=665100 ORGANISM="Litonotus pictus, Strain P1" /NCGR_SAMPLE_ID=MMETSP0209 /ASSEMBLY_ACC=CAM_ASM_000301 /LENGTH=153 /DNA_ID=CAMNT_0010826761 /DNA_START=237 /DNA_END=698 /DNA_ORIENTATION=+
MFCLDEFKDNPNFVLFLDYGKEYLKIILKIIRAFQVDENSQNEATITENSKINNIKPETNENSEDNEEKDIYCRVFSEVNPFQICLTNKLDGKVLEAVIFQFFVDRENVLKVIEIIPFVPEEVEEQRSVLTTAQPNNRREMGYYSYSDEDYAY